MKNCFLRVLFGGVAVSVLSFALLILSALFVVSNFSDHKVLASLDIRELAGSGFIVDVFLFFVAFLLFGFIFSLVVYFFWSAFSLRSLRKDVKGYWLLLLISFLLIVLWNTCLYPRSFLAGGVERGDYFLWGTWALTALLLFLAFGGFYSSWLWRPKPLISLISIAAVGSVLGVGASGGRYDGEKPDVIIIGFDSLRPDMITAERMPRLAHVLRESVRFEHAVTPMARTYPAWMSILTGVYPIKHGARFNLIPFSFLNSEYETLPAHLRRQGYQSLYATDEKRFANIDERHGFEVLLGPRIGVSDFLIGFISDMPIINFARQLPYSRELLPYVYSNRAVSASYMGHDFVREVSEGVSGLKSSMPAFMVVHFCEPHWPYAYVSKAERREKWLSPYSQEGNFLNYVKSLRLADEQFATVMDSLRDAGRLDNALVFFVSDHGESFGRDTITFKSSIGGQDFVQSSTGHGTDAADRSQFQVLLAYQQYQDGRLINQGATKDSPRVSLLDIYPTIMEYLNIEDGKVRDGVSLFKVKEQAQRDFFVETGFSVPAILKRNPNMADAFMQGMNAYQVEPNGYVSLRPDKVREILLQKEFSVMRGQYLVTYGSYQDVGTQFRLFDFLNMQWRPLEKSGGQGVENDLQMKICKQFSDDPRLASEGVCRN
jgi:hypothetical protein